MRRPKLRVATSTDAPSIAALSGQLGYPSSAIDIQQRLAALLESREHAVFVACVDAAVVGWIHVFLAQRVESGPFAELGGFVVDESHRRSGIGRHLLEAAVEWARNRAVAKLRVRTRTGRDDAHAFYEKFGFSLNKEQRVYDKALDGDPGARGA